MCVASNDMRLGMNDGLDAIRREIEAHGSDVTKECMRYVLDEEAGSSDTRFQSGHQRDRDTQTGEILKSRLLPEGRGMRLADFAAHPSAKSCRLELEEVAGLRIYSTAGFMEINNPLRDRERFSSGEAVPLPITTKFISSALGKLDRIEGS